MAEVDYGYGDDMDYGYGEPDPEPEPSNEPAPERRPKRRCSVTKFSLPEETPLNAASIINDMRNGTMGNVGGATTPVEEPTLVTEEQKGGAADAGGVAGQEASGEGGERNAPGRQRSGVLRFLKRR